MSYESKTNAQLIEEIEQMQKKIASLEDQTAKHQRSERIINRAKEEWERTFDLVPDLIAIIDNDHRIVRVNQSMAERLGLTPRECVGAICYEVVHGLSSPPDFCPHSKTAIDGKEYHQEVTEERLGGVFDVTTSPFFDKEGNVIGSAHVARDITDRKRAVETLQESKDQFRAIVEGTNACLFSTDERGRFSFINEAALKALGYTNGELIGKFYLSFVHSKDKRRVHEVFRDQLKTGKKSATIEFRYLTKSGSVGWFMFLVNPIIKNEKIIGLTGVAQDITKRRQIEEALREGEARFRKIIKNTEAGYFFIDRDGNFRRVNQAWLEMHKYDSSKEVLGQHFSLTQVEVDIEEAQRIVQSLLEGVPVPSSEFSRRCKDGSVGYHTFSVRPVLQSGQIIGIEGFIIDITERKQAEEALRESEE